MRHAYLFPLPQAENHSPQTPAQWGFPLRLCNQTPSHQDGPEGTPAPTETDILVCNPRTQDEILGLKHCYTCETALLFVKCWISFNTSPLLAFPEHTHIVMIENVGLGCYHLFSKAAWCAFTSGISHLICPFHNLKERLVTQPTMSTSKRQWCLQHLLQNGPFTTAIIRHSNLTWKYLLKLC